MTDIIGVHPMGLLVLVVAGQGVLLAAVILALRIEQRLINGFLSIYLLAESIGISGNFFVFSDLLVPGWMYLLPVVSVLAGPAILLYVKALTQPEFRLSFSLLWHLLPVVVAALGLFMVLHDQLGNMLPGPPHAGLPPPSFLPKATILINILMVFYGVAALRVLHLHRLQVETVFSNIETVSLSWLRQLLLFLLLAWCSYIVIDILQLTGLGFNVSRYQVSVFVTALIIYLISIGGMRQSVIFRHSLAQALVSMDAAQQLADGLDKAEASKALDDEQSCVDEAHKADSATAETTGVLANKTPIDDIILQEKYAKSGMSQDRAVALWQSLIDVMQTDKPYLNNDLTLPDLAELLSVSSQALSLLINTQANESFYQFINRYRVESAKRLLVMEVNRGRRLLEIAEDAGFNSHSTFYNHFKKLEGVTPAQYRDSQTVA